MDKAFQILAPTASKYIIELRFQKGWASLYTRNFNKVLEYWQRYRFLEEIEEIVDFENSIVLDIGCGVSTLLNHINAKQKVAVDPLMEGYKKFFSFPKDVKLEVGYGEKLPFDENTFGVVICTNAIDHTSNPSRTMEEIHRILKPSGKLILSVEINPPGVKRDAAHPHNIGLDDVNMLLEKFSVVFHEKSPFIGFQHYTLGFGVESAQTYEHIFVGVKK